MKGNLGVYIKDAVKEQELMILLIVVVRVINLLFGFKKDLNTL